MLVCTITMHGALERGKREHPNDTLIFDDVRQDDSHMQVPDEKTPHEYSKSISLHNLK